MLKINIAAEPAYRAVMPFFLPMTDTQRSLYTAQDAMDELVECAEDYDNPERKLQRSTPIFAASYDELLPDMLSMVGDIADRASSVATLSRLKQGGIDNASIITPMESYIAHQARSIAVLAVLAPTAAGQTGDAYHELLTAAALNRAPDTLKAATLRYSLEEGAGLADVVRLIDEAETKIKELLEERTVNTKMATA